MELHKALRNYYIVYSLQHFGYAIPTGILFLFIIQKGFDLQEIGFIFGTLAATIVLLELPTGGLADAIGRKKTAILSYILNASAIVVLLFATNLFIALSYAILGGIGRTLGSGSLDAWFIDQIKKANPNEDLQPHLSKADTFNALSSTLGAFCGGLLPFITIQFFPNSSIEPLSTTLLLSLFVRMFSLWALIRLIPEDEIEKPQGLHPAQSVKIILTDALTVVRENLTLIKLLVVTLANGFALGAFDAFWQPFLELELNVSAENTLVYGSIQAMGFLCGALGASIAVWYTTRLKSHGNSAFTLQFVKASIFLVLSLTTNIFVIALAIIIFYIVLVMGLSTHGALYNHNLPNHLRSSLMSVSGLMFFIGAGLGALLVGYLANNFGFQMAYFVLAVATALSSLLYIGMKLSEKPQEN